MTTSTIVLQHALGTYIYRSNICQATGIEPHLWRFSQASDTPRKSPRLYETNKQTAVVCGPSPHSFSGVFHVQWALKRCCCDFSAFHAFFVRRAAAVSRVWRGLNNAWSVICGHNCTGCFFEIFSHICKKKTICIWGFDVIKSVKWNFLQTYRSKCLGVYI